MISLTKPTRAGRPLMQPDWKPHPHYTLQAFLGSGSFGEVWEATGRDGERVALKFMRCRDDRAAHREMRAVQMMRELSHPNLLRIESIWPYKNYLVVAMELADGGMDHLLQTYQFELGTPVAPEHILLCLEQVADVLDFLNRRQHRVDGQLVSIQHGDVKPSNMLLFGTTVKLADFGLAAAVALASQPHRRSGTSDFAAHELFQGSITTVTDQFALAVSYVQLRTGRLPFPSVPGGIPLGYVRPEPDLSRLSPVERPLVARALDSNPIDRWPSCTQFILSLVDAIFE